MSRATGGGPGRDRGDGGGGGDGARDDRGDSGGGRGARDGGSGPAPRLRAAILTREFPPEVYGGAGVHVAELASALSPLVDVEVHCFGPPRDSPLVAGSYEPWSALGTSSPESAALAAVSVDLAMAAGLGGRGGDGSGGRGPPAVCHSHTWYTNLAGHLAGLLWGIPHVATTHSLEPLRPWKVEQLGGGYALSSWCERTGLEGADAVVAVSAAMRDDILACYHDIDPDRVDVVHNGIDARRWRPDPGTGALERLGLDPDDALVVFVGRVTRQKGLVHLLGAARLLDRRTHLVCCAGAADTPELAAEVRGLVEEVRAAGVRLTWVEGQLPQPEVAQLLTHARVLVCPSVYEPFGLVNLEAMACGTAVVASAVGGIPEVVVDGETGLLVEVEMEEGAAAAPLHPRRFAADLAERMGELVDDPARARRLGEAGRRRAVESFGWPAVAE
ncbi:MAG: glycogen synthase, partial [Acidimicrobiales bacterium]